MDATLKHVATIQLGGLTARLGIDGQGRQCAAIKLGHQDVLFTITHALVVREILDASIRAMTEFVHVVDPDPGGPE